MYSKPDVKVLGNAAQLITQSGTTPKSGMNVDGAPLLANPSYDLDE